MHEPKASALSMHPRPLTRLPEHTKVRNALQTGIKLYFFSFFFKQTISLQVNGLLYSCSITYNTGPRGKIKE